MPHRGEDHEADEHPDTTRDQRPASTEVLDHVQAPKRGTEVDPAEDHLCDEDVADTGPVEDRRTLL